MISVIVCTYNRAAMLSQVLNDLLGQNLAGRDWEILVVDNNSKDDTAAVVRAAANQTRVPVRYVFEGKQGKSNALNTGMANAKGELLLFTDDDVRVDADWVRALAAAFAETGCDFAGGRILATWSGDPPTWYTESGPYALMDAVVRFDLGSERRYILKHPYGANMAIRKGLAEAVGGFRADLGPIAGQLRRGEDTDLSARLHKAGKSCLYVPEAVVHHPVEEARTRRAYFLDWYFWYGVITITRDGVPATAPRIFRVPRYLIRQLLENCLRWWTAFGTRRRFYFKLNAYMTWGSIVQSWRVGAGNPAAGHVAS